MKHVYKFFCGRKMFYFNLLLAINTVALFKGKYNDGFGYFCVFLYLTIVAGVEGNKFIKGKLNEKTNQE